MARRMRSLTAAANRGKEAEVIINNLMAAGAKSRRSRQKAKAQEERAKERNRREQAKAQERAAARAERVAERRSREASKRHEKEQKFHNRLALEFREKGLILTEDLSQQIVSKALDASITVSQLNKYFIDGKEHTLQTTALSQIIGAFLGDAVGLGEWDDYMSQSEQLVAQLVERSYASVADVEADSEYREFANNVIDRESHLRLRAPINEEISALMEEIIDKHLLLPDDIEKLSDIVELDKGMTLTVEQLKASEEYNEGIMKKAALVERVNAQYAKLLAR